MEKRGLSAVITTLLIILLVMVAIAVVWGVISNIVNKGSDQIGLGAFTVDVEVQKVIVNEGSIDVLIHRKKGQGDLTGLKIIVSDGVEKQTFDIENPGLDELATKKINIPYEGVVKSVSIAPTISQSGSEQQQNIQDELQIDTRDAIKNIPGLIYWWSLDGNTNDNKGTHNLLLGDIGGVCTTDGEAPPTYVEGKFNQGILLDGCLDIIQTNAQAPFAGNTSSTFSGWINIKSNPIGSPGAGIIGYIIDYPTSLIINPQGNLTYTITYFVSQPEKAYYVTSLQPTKNQWNYVAATYKDQIATIYLNDQKEEITITQNLFIYTTFASIGTTSSMNPAPQFTTYALNGTIDEVMIFNRNLSEAEIQSIYRTDLSS